MLRSETVQKRLPTLALMLVAVIWGAGFMGVQIALDSGFSEGFILLCRFGVAALLLLAVAHRRIFPIARADLIHSLIAGTLLFLGFYIQTVGLRFTTPSNNGFFTAANVMMVPFIAWALQKKRPPVKLIFCCLIALAGFFLLVWNPGQGFSFNAGDLLTLLSAFFFACQIAYMGIAAAKVELFRLTFLQMSVAFILSLASVAIFERPALAQAQWSSGLPAVLFLGIFCTCACFLMQAWAQSRTGSGKAAVIMSCESLWCMVFSVMLGYERLSAPMVAGGVAIVGAVCLLEVELPGRRKEKTGETMVV